MSRSAATRTHQARLPPEGFPGHVRGWCVKAGEGTMKQGYRDVGYLFAPHVHDFRPSVSAHQSHVFRGADGNGSRWLSPDWRCAAGLA